MKFAEKLIVANDMATIVEEAWHDALRETFYIAQTGVSYVIYDRVEQVALDLLLVDVIRETLHGHIENLLKWVKLPRDSRTVCRTACRTQHDLWRLLRHWSPKKNTAIEDKKCSSP